MYKKDNPLQVLVCLCFLVSLLATQMPLVDFDRDGLLDTTDSEGFVILPALSSLTFVFFLLLRLLIAYLPAPQYHFSQQFPPPISN